MKGSAKELMAIVWLISLSILELLSIGQTSRIAPCILVSSEAGGRNQSGYDACAPMHEGIVRFISFLWDYTTHDNIIALGTVAVAVFTWTLWQSSEKMWKVTKVNAEAANVSAFVSRKLLEDKFAGRLTVRNLGIHPPTEAYPAHISFEFQNGGDAPIEVEEATIDVRVRVFSAGKGRWMPQVLSEPWGVALATGEKTGLNRMRCVQLTQRDVENIRQGIGAAFLIFNVKYRNTLARYDVNFGFSIDPRNGSFSKTPISQIPAAHDDRDDS